MTLGAYMLTPGWPDSRMHVPPDPDPCLSCTGMRSVYEALMACHYARSFPPPDENLTPLNEGECPATTTRYFKRNSARPSPGSRPCPLRATPGMRAPNSPQKASLLAAPHRPTRFAEDHWRRALGYSCFLTYVLLKPDKEAAAGTPRATVGIIADSASKGAEQTWITGMDPKTRATIKDSHDREPGMGMICPGAPRMAKALQQAVGGWKLIHKIAWKPGMDWTGGRKVCLAFH